MDLGSPDQGVARQASLPLYGLAELRPAKAAFWRAIRTELERAGERPAPATLDFTQPIVPERIGPEVLFSQVCGYPLQKLFGSQALILAAPVYDAEYCEGATHCGVFVVHRDAPYQRLADLKHCRYVYGGPHSNSGMNLPRRSIAGIAGGAPFFGEAIETDSQVGNLELVARHEVDATCVDNVTFAFVVRHRPQVAAMTRVLALTARSRTIPFVTSSATEPATVGRLHRALKEVGTAPEWEAARAGLMLHDIVPIEGARYGCLLEYEQEAVALGYPVLC
jgi:ABC-type phosphate/phosphonate transport system substrate-binding protein